MDQVIQKLFASGKGILANDASVTSLTKRLGKYGIDATLENRNKFREIFYSTSEVQLYISGVILNEEAISYAPTLLESGILPGVKVDKGLQPFGLDGKEHTTTGIEDLSTRLALHKSKGAVFTKWRAAFVISPTTPSQSAIEENIKLLVEYAKVSLEHELVPILEPEVLMEGDHSAAETSEVTRRVFTSLFAKIDEEGITLENIILKTNMIVAGVESEVTDSSEVGRLTVSLLNDVVPKNIGGIVFLSGGQGTEKAIENMHAILSYAASTGYTVPMTYSFERVFEEPVLQAWSKDLNNVEAAQAAFLEVAKKL